MEAKQVRNSTKEDRRSFAKVFKTSPLPPLFILVFRAKADEELIFIITRINYVCFTFITRHKME
jgi:hypothetical protein